MSQTTLLQHTLPPAPTATPSPAAPPAPTGGVLARVRAAVPTLVVVGVLGALAAWGQSMEWRMPSFSSLVGGEAAEGIPWCTDHNVPAGDCIECRADLVPKLQDHGWCKLHGIAQCPFEHPDVAQAKTPEPLSAEDEARAARALAVMPRPENRSLCKLHERRIQFASTAAIEKAGVDIAVVQRKPLVESIVANGEIVYDATRTAELASRVSGTVWRVKKEQGDPVRAGEVLALIDSAAVGEAKTGLLQAISQLRLREAAVARLQPLADKVVAGRQLSEALTAQEEARIDLLGAQQALANLGLDASLEELLALDSDRLIDRVRNLGLSTQLVQELSSETSTLNLFPLRAPIDGVVVQRRLTSGEVVDRDAPLFRIADVDRMWLMLDVRQDDIQYVQVGQKVAFQPSGAAGPDIEGAVSWIATEADDETRTVKVRVVVPNQDRTLRANTFGEGRIVLREETDAIMVPTEAIHWDGCCHVVFVRDKHFFEKDAPKFFHVRKVRLGAEDGDHTEIIAGLVPTEVIAGKNSVVLEAQLLKSNLGAGCCELHTPKK